jgi:hypothetical protein
MTTLTYAMKSREIHAGRKSGWPARRSHMLAHRGDLVNPHMTDEGGDAAGSEKFLTWRVINSG